VGLTLTGVFIWFTGGSQGLGYAIFMAGGVMWFILQWTEKKKLDNAKQDSPVLETPNETRMQRPPRQSDLIN
jgi:hypothetical protein